MDSFSTGPYPEEVGGKRAFYGLHCVTFLINITAHPTATSCSSQALSSAAVTREEKGKPRLQLRTLGIRRPGFVFERVQN